MSKASAAVESQEQIVYLPPEAILADDNSRFNLKKSREDSLMQSILEAGGVLSPVEVEPIQADKKGGPEYRLTSGFYRHRAVARLNAEQQAGLLLPVIVRPMVDDTQRIKHQLAENMERENQSPMDQAVAIQKLLALGIERKEIRRIFSRPVGRKGNAIQPASNAWVNITLRLLELPKSIQQKIHDGAVGFAAAYELGRVSPEKRQAVLDRAEGERTRLLEAEEKDEESYLKAEQRVQQAADKEASALAEAEAAKAEVAQVEGLLNEKVNALRMAQANPETMADDAKVKKVAQEAVKGAETDVKAAQKLLKDTKNKVAKLLGTAKTAAETAAEQREKLENARKALKAKKPTGKAPIGVEEVKKAAREEGEGSGHVSLSLSDIRVAVKDIGASKGYPKVAAIGLILGQLIAGVHTTKGALELMAEVTGERKKAAPVKMTTKQPAPK